MTHEQKRNKQILSAMERHAKKNDYIIEDYTQWNYMNPGANYMERIEALNAIAKARGISDFFKEVK